MIAWVEGVLREKQPTRVVVVAGPAGGGVGYELLVSLSTFTALPDEGKSVELHVHTHARENAIQLYGFATLHERDAFELLLRANRVGPKLAQTILSGHRGESNSSRRFVDRATWRRCAEQGPRRRPEDGRTHHRSNFRDRVDGAGRRCRMRTRPTASQRVPPPSDAARRPRSQLVSALVEPADAIARNRAEKRGGGGSSPTRSPDAKIEDLVRTALREPFAK